MLSFKTALAILLVPGGACFLVPYIILTIAHIPLDRNIGVPQVLAIPIAALGMYMVLWVGMVFVRRGRGTPIPIEPPARLVVTGIYRYVRNPIMVIFEEPQLKRRFGMEYERYQAAVPRWIPRFRKRRVL